MTEEAKPSAITMGRLRLLNVEADCYELGDGERVMACDLRQAHSGESAIGTDVLRDLLRGPAMQSFAFVISVEGRDVRVVGIEDVLEVLLAAYREDKVLDRRWRTESLIRAICRIGIEAVAFEMARKVST